MVLSTVRTRAVAMLLDALFTCMRQKHELMVVAFLLDMCMRWQLFSNLTLFTLMILLYSDAYTKRHRLMRPDCRLRF